MNNNQYSVEVLVNGRPVREFQHNVNGEQKTFIEARYGTNYSLRVTNHGHQKVLAIASVDGLNVVSGKIGNGFSGRGYIIPPHDSVVIKGFRESDNSVGSFEFTSKEGSYAAEKGLERNVGVIACNIIDEKPQPIKVVTKIVEHHHHHHDIPKPAPWPIYPQPKPYFGDTIIGTTTGDNATYTSNLQARSMNSSSAGGQHVNSIGGNMKKSTAFFDAGTRWGERIDDRITRKHFEKNQIVASFSIYYATYEGLKSIGVPMYHEKEIDLPNGFEGYCKPPKNWKKNGKKNDI